MVLKTTASISMRFKIIISTLILILFFIQCTSVSAEYTEDTHMIISPDYELTLEVPPPDYEVVPDYDDGVVILEMGNPWTYLVYWKDFLPLSIVNHFELLTKNGDITNLTKSLLVSAFTILISLPFLIIFSRRLNPEEIKDSTPARILKYISEHPVSSLQNIVNETGKSRGSVSYQLMHLEKERKIVSHEINGRKYYSTLMGDVSPLSVELLCTISNKRTKEVFISLLEKPNQTISEIAEDIRRNPNAVNYQMKRISSGIITKTDEKRNTRYSINQEAVNLYYCLFPKEIQK